MSGQSALDTRAIPTIEWRPFRWPRLEFQEPGRDGVLFGFLFRLIGAIVAIVFSTLVLSLWGAFNGWVLTTPLLALHFTLIAIVVALAEHLR